MDIILASASPRRQELLKTVFDIFSVVVSDIEETAPDEIPLSDIPQYLAVKKAGDVAKDYPDSLVIGCDTGVFIDNKMLGKPQNDDDAFNMLKLLSGRSHTVITGCALYLKGKHLSFHEETQVTFSKLSDEEIKEYIATKDPLDKAGSYGIQGRGAVFVERINGDFYNVMGLPVCRLNKEIKKFLDIFI